MYAVVKTGGKQYKVAPGDRLRVEKIDSPVGEIIQLDKVEMIAKGDAGIVVEPAALASARVIAQIKAHGLAKKIRVYKYKRRKGYERTQGHRQNYTELEIQEIQE